MDRPVMPLLYYSAGMLITLGFWAMLPVFIWHELASWRWGQAIDWVEAGLDLGMVGFYLAITPVIVRRWRRLWREVRR